MTLGVVDQILHNKKQKPVYLLGFHTCRRIIECGIHFSSLYRITELLSRIKYVNRGIFYDMTLGVVDQIFA